MKKHGFTLIEMLVVVAVVGILGGLVAGSVSGMRVRAAETEVRTALIRGQTAQEMYRTRAGVYFAGTVIPSYTRFAVPRGITFRFVSANANSYCMDARNPAYNNLQFRINQNGAVNRGSC